MDIERLTVKVHLLGEPCLWCWEIVDVEDDALVESSWATEWTGYASSREALRAGTLRLTDLTRSSRGAPLHARRTPAAGQRNQTRYLVVVARAADRAVYVAEEDIRGQRQHRGHPGPPFQRAPATRRCGVARSPPRRPPRSATRRRA